jgi:hypothetical protein
MKKKSMFYTDGQGRTRYMGKNDAKQSQPTSRISVVETAPQRKALQFITNEEGRVIPIGGPSGGAGGASASSGNIVIPPDIQKNEFINMRTWQDLGHNTGDVPIYLSERTLPPVPEGMERFYHGTWAYNAESIAKSGLMPGSMTGTGERLRTTLGTINAPSGFGEINFVVDLPKGTINKLGGDERGAWGEISQVIKPQNMVGILLTKPRSNDISKTVGYYIEWDPSIRTNQ